MHQFPGPEDPRTDIDTAATAKPPTPPDEAAGAPTRRKLTMSPVRSSAPPLASPHPVAPAVRSSKAGQGSRASGRALGILVGILLVLSIIALL